MAKLFTADVDKKLFEQYKYGSDLSKQEVVAKVFNPYGRGTWYLINSDPQDPDYIWAIVDLFEVEVGSVSRNDLMTIKVPPFQLPLERDKFFQPMNALELYKRLRGGETFESGGRIDEMVEHWNKYGWASSHINNNDSEFFEKIGKTSMEVPTTSFTGNDVKYYDEDKVDVVTGGFKQKFESGGATDCGCQHKMEDGGEIVKSNNEMLKSQVKAVKHHAEELSNIVTDKTPVEAWVVGKVERASTDLSDITHYLDGKSNKMAKGGELEIKKYNEKEDKVTIYAVKNNGKIQGYILYDIEEGFYSAKDNSKEGGVNFEFRDFDTLNEAKEYIDSKIPNTIYMEYAKGGTIETDTPIIVGMVAEKVATYKYFEKNHPPKQDETELIKKASTEISKLEKHLEQKANTVYANNEMFKKQINQKGNRGRDSLYMYMEHWADAYLSKHKMAGGGELKAEYQVLGNGGKYLSRSVGSGNLMWSDSPDMGYLYTKEDAEKMAKYANESLGINDCKVVKYDKNWWKYEQGGETFAKGGGFDQYGKPYGFEYEKDSVYEWHHNPDNKEHPYQVWDKIDGIYVAGFPSRQRAIEWIERKESGVYAKGGEIGLYVAVDEVDGFWYIISKPTTKENAQKQVTKESQKVVTLEEAKSHKKVIGKEYLEQGGEVYAKGGGLSFDSVLDKTTFSQGLKESLKKDLLASGYNDFSELKGETIKDTKQNIERKVLGFDSGKNTYLQAKMIAEIIHNTSEVYAKGGEIPFNLDWASNIKKGDNIIIDNSWASDDANEEYEFIESKTKRANNSNIDYEETFLTVKDKSGNILEKDEDFFIGRSFILKKYYAKGGGVSRSQKQYNKEVDAYKYFIVDLKNKKAISGWEHRSDANDALSDYDGDRNYKVVAEVTLRSLGIENPKEEFKKFAKGGYISSDEYRDKLEAMTDNELLAAYCDEYGFDIEEDDHKERIEEERDMVIDDMVERYQRNMKSTGRMAKGGEISENELLKWANTINDENLLSWCGYSSKREFEDSADVKYSKKNLVETNYDDLLYVYENKKDYGFAKGGEIKEEILSFKDLDVKIKYNPKFKKWEGLHRIKNPKTGEPLTKYGFDSESKVSENKDDLIKEYKQEYGEVYAKGGKVSFKDKVKAISSRLEGTKVKPKYQKQYGKTYNKSESVEAATKIAGKQVAKSKMAKGGKVAEGEWVVYDTETHKPISLKKSFRAAKMYADKLFESGKYDGVGSMSKSEYEKKYKLYFPQKELVYPK